MSGDAPVSLEVKKAQQHGKSLIALDSSTPLGQPDTGLTSRYSYLTQLFTDPAALNFEHAPASVQQVCHVMELQPEAAAKKIRNKESPQFMAPASLCTIGIVQQGYNSPKKNNSHSPRPRDACIFDPKKNKQKAQHA